MTEITVRRADPGEHPRLVELATSSLGWNPSDPNGELFAWKHTQNHFGDSPLWVAEVGGTLAGFRAFLRWEFRAPDNTLASAARTVDTATHPDFQGRGIFTHLTRHAVEELIDEGVDFIFNTPNEQSRPGYIKMGWREAGRLPIGIRVRLGGLRRLVRARAPAEKWSLPPGAGDEVGAVFDDETSLHALLGTCGSGRFTTRRSAAFYRWRYGFEPLAYRAVTAGSAAEGFIIFRRRQRGPAVEVTVCDLVVPPADRLARTRELIARLRRDVTGDYLIRAGGPMIAAGGFVRLPAQGPLITVRDLATTAPGLADLDLALGDIELF